MDPNSTPRANVRLSPVPVKRLARPSGSKRDVLFTLTASAIPDPNAAAQPVRRPLSLALVLDRSGSMSGVKLEMAKTVAERLIAGMTEQDEVAMVIFDDHIDTLQERAPVTPEVKAQIKRRLARVEARGSTALHEAWLRGCEALAGETVDQTRLSRCYLLTDGQANIGETDPETIATQAAGIRERAGVSTSTFGLGDDYNEHLLGPVAVAGGGQFHDMATPRDMTAKLLGERDDLREVVALRVRLEVEMDDGLTGDAISIYQKRPDAISTQRWMLDIGDLMDGEERTAVVRFTLPPLGAGLTRSVRSRVLWMDGAGEQRSEWSEITFTYAANVLCNEEQPQREALREAGLAHADRATRDALKLSKEGDRQGAVALLRRVAERIRTYAGDDFELRDAAQRLEELAEGTYENRLSARERKMRYASMQTSSRKQKDYTDPDAF